MSIDALHRSYVPLALAACLAGCNLLMEANFRIEDLKEEAKTESSSDPQASPVPPVPSGLSGLPSNNTQSLLVDVPSGKIYVGTSDAGLGVYTASTDSWTTYTTTHGLAGNFVNSLTTIGGKLFVGTASGLSVSNNGGVSWEPTLLSGLVVGRIVSQGSTLYAATFNGSDFNAAVGPSVSTDGGVNWSNTSAAAYVQGVGATNTAVFAAAGTNGLYRLLSGTGAGWVFNLGGDFSGVFVLQGTMYAVGYNSGLHISSDNGNNWTQKTTGDGLASDITYAVSVSEGKIYVATVAGLSISSNNGSTWTTKTVANGLGSNVVLDVYAVGSTIYGLTSNGLSISTDGGTSFNNIHP